MVGGHVGGHLAATMGEIFRGQYGKVTCGQSFLLLAFTALILMQDHSIATPQMQVKQAIMKTTDKVFVLADSTKFGGGYLSLSALLNLCIKSLQTRKFQNRMSYGQKEKVFLW